MFRFAPRLLMTNIAFADVCRVVSAKDSPAGDKNTVIIDVRSAEEVQRTGTIPHALHIPVNIIKEVLAEADPEAFMTTFKHEKPDPKRHTLLVYCHAGVRSLAASDAAEELGYKVLHYPEGFAGWSVKSASR